MMKNKIKAIVVGSLLSCSAFASDGLVSVPSEFSVTETANRFANIIEKKGLKLFARINHKENAAGVDLELRPTELVMFGNPKVGTPLMQCTQRVAIDLPQKALIWEDEKGKVWFSYNDPSYLKQRHSVEGCDKVIDKITTVLGKLSQAATQKQ